MSKGLLVMLSNPISTEREDEFNNWYDTIHSKEIMALPGFRTMRRYRIVKQIFPPTEAIQFSYLVVYDVDNGADAVKALLENQHNFALTDSVDFAGVLGAAFEEIFSV